MDGLGEVTWVQRMPSSSMEHHIETFAVGMRISEMPDELSMWIKDRIEDDSDVINQRQLDRMHNDNCDTDVCSKCGSPEARPVAVAVGAREDWEETVMLCNECCTAKYEREFDTFVTRDEKKIRDAAALGIKPQAVRTVGGESPSQAEWLGMAPRYYQPIPQSQD
jgi:hypothetical protein